MEPTTVTPTATLTPVQQQQLVAIRATLPAQERAAELDEVRLRYRTLRYGALRRRVVASLPQRLFRRRHIHEWDVREYPRLIPDAVLLKYAEAVETHLFRAFYVIEPSYETQMPAVRSDPWLIGKVSGTYNFILEHADRVAVIAYWE